MLYFQAEIYGKFLFTIQCSFNSVNAQSYREGLNYGILLLYLSSNLSTEISQHLRFPNQIGTHADGFDKMDAALSLGMFC